MRKKLIIVFFIVITTLSMLTACINNPWKNRVIENALIERIFADMMHVQVIFENGDIQHYNINICDNIQWNGKAIAPSDLHVGDHIRVTYDGAIIELYPALVEGTTKIELLSDAISPPTTEFRAVVDAIENGSITVTALDTNGYDGQNFTFFLSDHIRYVQDHHVIERTEIGVGDTVFVTYQGALADTLAVIRIEIHQKGGSS